MKKHATVQFQRISLRPYPGEVRRFKKLRDMRLHYEHHVGPYPYKDEDTGGRFIFIESNKNSAGDFYLVYGKEPHVLAHEYAHCILHTFKRCGIDPTEGNGEPFCYMLSQLVLDGR